MASHSKKGELRFPVRLPERAAARVIFNSDGTARIVFPQVELDGDAMNFFRDEFLPALEHGDVKRVRVCPICDKLFFALRLAPTSLLTEVWPRISSARISTQS